MDRIVLVLGVFGQLSWVFGVRSLKVDDQDVTYLLIVAQDWWATLLKTSHAIGVLSSQFFVISRWGLALRSYGSGQVSSVTVHSIRILRGTEKGLYYYYNSTRTSGKHCNTNEVKERWSRYIKYGTLCRHITDHAYAKFQ